ncbi:MAG TPA: hypothetical protein VM432_01095 [Bdellovibrionales bacterium]|jgi:hypothetical protein|nr:hypothetical protein [Bdellovibrionales bacterium]
MRIISVLLISIFLSGAAATGAVRTENSVAGSHYPLFRFEKSENPQNVIIPYTRLDSWCRFQESDPLKTVDFYWLNNGQTPKDAHRLIKSGIRKRLETKDESSSSVSFKIKRGKDVKTDSLAALEFTLEASKESGTCEVITTARLGQGKNDDLIYVEKVKAETKRTMLPPFRKLLSLTIEGKSVKDGQHIKRVFKI